MKKYLGVNQNIYGLIGLARRAGKLSFGIESCKQEIEKGKGKLIIIAKDISEKTKSKIEELAKVHKVPLRQIGTIEELSNSIGQVKKAIIVIKEENLAKELIKRIDGGEIIG